MFVHLVHIDTFQDFALFRLDDKEIKPKDFITLEQLACTSSMNYSIELANRRVFTIGYNQRNGMHLFPTYFEQYLEVVSPSRRDDLKDQERGRSVSNSLN